MGKAKYIIGGVLVAIGLFWVLAWAGIVPGLRNIDTVTIKKGKLVVWGTVDDAPVFGELIGLFQASNPGIEISYFKKAEDSYEQDLIRAFAAGVGPDIFSAHHTSLRRYSDLISAAPPEIFPAAEFREQFVDVAQRDFLFGENLFGVPLYVDTLALYYNIDLFNSAGFIFPPKDWDEFTQYSRELTKRKQSGDIIVSGAAIGGGKNVVSASDILNAFMLQNGVVLANEEGKVNFRTSNAGTGLMATALEFYTSFARQTSPNYSWSGTSAGDSETMFAQGKVAMMLGYASAKTSIMNKSPRLRFAVAPFPQVKNATIKRNYANYSGYVVYKNSPNTATAWQFLHFLAQKDISAYYGTSGRPGAQRSVVAIQQKDSQMKVFAEQALSAVSWVQYNAEVVKQVFTDMIDTQIASDQPLQQTILNAETTINALIKK
ncbi:MAG: extracellular solute-binding protein [Candidatus Azambacteria bacterium]|nr:extracellular solute-binding protein [Candidatus Azambacteria bacterium]